MKKRVLSVILSLLLIMSSALPLTAFADAVQIGKSVEFKNALKTDLSYELTKGFIFSSSGITGNVKIDGCGNTIEYVNDESPASLYQNEYARSEFSNLIIQGNKKLDVGIWLSNGEMTFNGCTIRDYEITSGRYSALAMVGSTCLTLNNTSFENNKDYDVLAYDTSTVNVNEGTRLDKIRFGSQFVHLNIGDNWNGSFEITLDYPAAKVIGTVGEGADVTGISISNSGYYVANENGKLCIKKSIETAVRFDMSQRDKLYKGSTGFLYGESEINVPSIDLLQGLKPDTMVQKAVGGLQHPTGDAVRTGSALLEAGVRDMQIYLQDIYLEWPYDAPIKNGQIDLDKYQLTVEKIIYEMVCNRVMKGVKDAFLGSDGNYYVVDKKKADAYSYVLFNEPDQIWYGWNLDGLEKAWNKIYTAVHNIYPDARCVGPNFSGFNADSYDKFLKYCYENNCLPEIISWHELGDISMTEFVEHYNYVESYVEKYYSADNKPELMVNEYARHYDIGAPGGLVKWLSMFEDKDMSGCMAYWAMANSLNEMAADQNSPTSTWWVYHWYAQMTGDQCPLTYPEFDKTRFYGVASYDEDINMAYILFGGSEDENMSEIVYADNLASTDLMNENGLVNVKLYGVGFSGQQGAEYEPECIFNGAVHAVDGTLRLELGKVDEMQAYFAVLTKPEESAEAESFDAELSTVSYEAEKATLLGTAVAYSKIGWTSFATSGRADVGNVLTNGSGVEFDVEVEEDGIYTASIFYSLQAPYVNPQTLALQENGQNRGIGKTLPFGVSVDGKPLDNIYLESTVTWAYKTHNDINIPLSKGRHKIRYYHINGDERGKGNLQLTAAFDKLDLTKLEDNNFEIDLTEMSNFKTENGYKVTAVAPESGYYTITADSEVSFTRQSVDYAPDAKTTSECSVYDIPVGDTVYLSKGANTIGVIGEAGKLDFTYMESETQDYSVTISADEITVHGDNAVYKSNKYANSKKVIAEIGVGQGTAQSYKQNYISFKVNADSKGVYNFSIRYTNDEPAPVMLKSDGSTYVHPYNIDLVERYAQISVNGGEPETVYFRNTMSWDTFRAVDVQFELKQGVNEIKIYNDNSYQFSSLVNSTAPEIDEITVSRQSFNGETVKKIAKTSTQRHSYKNVVTKATTSKNGKITSSCTVCGATKPATTIYYPKTVTLSTTSYTYNGSAKKPSVTVKDSKGNKIASSNYTVTYASGRKNVGKYSVKITFKGNYSGTVTKYFTIKPKSTSISSLKAGSKKFTVKWKKLTTQTTGYQIQYSTSSSFKNAKTVTVSKNKTTSKTISKLKAKKKYYVRIRTYKTVNGTKYYSSWSAKKSITTKK